MHVYDECVERIKSKNDTGEAREWLEATGRDYGVIHEMSHEESVEVVEEAYQRGAELVEVVGNLSEILTDTNVNMLLITLPKDRNDRELLFDLEETIAEMTGFDRSVDEGQQYILLR